MTSEQRKADMEIAALTVFMGHESPAYIADVGAMLEELGFSTIWVPEHVLFFPEYTPNYPFAEDGQLMGEFKGVLNPFGLLYFFAAKTSRIRLGTGICIVPQHNPVYLATHVADLDRLSEGRFDFGVGVGWQREEYDALGIPFSERGRRMDDSLDAMKALWTQDVSTHHGEFYQFEQAWSHPKPVQLPSPPILVGGDSPAALRRVATHGDGWFGYNLTAESCEASLKKLEKQLNDNGASLSERRLIAAPAVSSTDADTVRAFRSLGIDQVVAHMEGSDLESVSEWAKRTRALID